MLQRQPNITLKCGIDYSKCRYMEIRMQPILNGSLFTIYSKYIFTIYRGGHARIYSYISPEKKKQTIVDYVPFEAPEDVSIKQ